MIRSVDADGVTTLYGYNALSERILTAIDLNGNNEIDLAVDRVSSSDRTLVDVGGIAYWQSEQSVYPQDGSDTAVLVGLSRQSVDGLSSESLPFGDVAQKSSSSTLWLGGGDWVTISQSATGSQSVQSYVDGRLVESSVSDGDNVLISKTTPGYDDLFRTTGSTDLRNNITTTYRLTNAGLPWKIDQLGDSTTEADDLVLNRSYDLMGRMIKEIKTTKTPNGSGGYTTRTDTTHTRYTSRGQVQATWGDLTYPKFYRYDALGKMVELRTFQNLAANVEPTLSTPGYASTEWIYNPDRGWLDRKEYDDGKGTDYTYTSAGRLDTRIWSRTNAAGQRVTTDYGYDVAGDLERTTYLNEDGITPDLVYLRDRMGRIETVSRNGSLHASYSYDPTDLQLNQESLNLDGSNPSVLNRYYDGLRRPLSVSLTDSGSNTAAHTYGYSYDTAGRLRTVLHEPALDAAGVPTGGEAFTYNYLASGGSLIESVVGPLHTVTNTWETGRDVLDVKANRKNGTDNTLLSEYDYVVNGIGQRTSVNQSGTAFDHAGATVINNFTLNWDYDDLGQVITEGHADTTRSNSYGYDRIGNRKVWSVGVSSNGTPLETTNYIPNSLNQYTSISGSPAPSHDEDGNLLTGKVQGGANRAFDGKVPFTDAVWDGENRLRECRVDGSLVSFDYDYLGRRIQASGGGFYGRAYVYDGWNLIELSRVVSSSTSAQLCTFTWGTDQSGSMQGAGGVGGLLVTRHAGRNAYPLYDGNGNAGQYIRRELDGNGNPTTAPNGDLVVEYSGRWEYDAFGRTTWQSDDNDDQWVNAHLHRFSTKEFDWGSGLYYYGYRYYNPVTGRWPSRDPIEEDGGVNLYAFVGNDPIGRFDYLGMEGFKTKDSYEMSMAGATPFWQRANNPFQYGTMYRSRSWGKAKRDIKKYFDQDKDGKLTEKDCPPFRIRMVGYSWGGWSSLILVKKLADIAEKPNEHYKIALGTLDPVKTARGAGGIAAGGLPPYVVKAFNAYQRNGMRVRRGFNWLLKNKFRGESVAGAVNINATNVKLPDWRVEDKNGNPTPQLVDHATIASRAGGGRSVYAQWVLDSVKQVPLK